jgi:hypothetical protein
MAQFKTVEEAELALADEQRGRNTDQRDMKMFKTGFVMLKKFLEDKGFNIASDTTTEALEEQWTGTAGKSISEAATATKKIDELTKKFAALQAEKDEAVATATNREIEGELKKGLSDVIGSDDVAALWVATKQVKKDGDKFYRVVNGKDVPLTDALAEYKKANPDRVKSSQSSGGGSSNSQQPSGAAATKLKKSEFNKMDNAAKQDFFAKGGEVQKDD